MALLRVRQGERVERMRPEALLDAIRLGGIPVAAEVQEHEGGAWVRAGAFFLDSSTIDPPRDEDSERFLATHVSVGLNQEDLLNLLGVDRADIEVRVINEPAPPPTPIEIPGVDPRGWDRRHVIKRIPAAAWNPDPSRVVVDHIRVPDWGAPWILPTIDEITVPEWVDPAVAVPPLGPRPRVVWRRQLQPKGAQKGPEAGAQSAGAGGGPQAVQAPDAPRRAESTPRSRREARARHQVQEKTRRADAQEAMRLLARERTGRDPRAPAGRPDRNRGPGLRGEAAPGRTPSEAGLRPKTDGAPAAAVTIRKGIGLFGCVGQLISLCALIFAIAVGLDIALDALSEVELPAALTHPDRSPSQPPDKKLRPFMTSGPAGAWMQVVIAADLGTPSDARATAALIAALDRAAEAGQLPGEGDLRLILLPRVGRRPGSQELATALLALARQGPMWRWLRVALRRKRPLRVEDLIAALPGLGVDRRQFDRLRSGAEAALQVRAWSTMADAIGLERHLAALNGRPLSARRIMRPKRLRAALEDALAKATAAADRHGDPGEGLEALAAELPERVRERYVRWILRGERMPGRPPAAHATPTSRATKGGGGR